MEFVKLPSQSDMTIVRLDYNFTFHITYGLGVAPLRNSAYSRKPGFHVEIKLSILSDERVALKH